MTASTFPRPTPPASHEPVRSCHVTPAMLRSWGFAVAGHVTTHDEWLKGEEFGKARHAAMWLGWSLDSHHQEHERTWVGTTKVTDEERAAGMELLAWFQAEGRHVATGSAA